MCHLSGSTSHYSIVLEDPDADDNEIVPPATTDKDNVKVRTD